MGTLLTHMVPLCELRKGCLLSRWLVAPQAKGNGNPLQYSCLENSVDRGTWWAAVHGVAQSQTQLKWLSSSSNSSSRHKMSLCWRKCTPLPGGCRHPQGTQFRDLTNSWLSSLLAFLAGCLYVTHKLHSIWWSCFWIYCLFHEFLWRIE